MNCVICGNPTHSSSCYCVGHGFPPRTHYETRKGSRMPETREQFNLMGYLYDKALASKDEEIARLKQRINKLEQKIEQLRKAADTRHLEG